MKAIRLTKSNKTGVLRGTSRPRILKSLVKTRSESTGNGFAGSIFGRYLSRNASGWNALSLAFLSEFQQSSSAQPPVTPVFSWNPRLQFTFLVGDRHTDVNWASDTAALRERQQPSPAVSHGKTAINRYQHTHAQSAVTDRSVKANAHDGAVPAAPADRLPPPALHSTGKEKQKNEFVIPALSESLSDIWFRQGALKILKQLGIPEHAPSGTPSGEKDQQVVLPLNRYQSLIRFFSESRRASLPNRQPLPFLIKHGRFTYITSTGQAPADGFRYPAAYSQLHSLSDINILNNFRTHVSASGQINHDGTSFSVIQNRFNPSVSLLFHAEENNTSTRAPDGRVERKPANNFSPFVSFSQSNPVFWSSHSYAQSNQNIIDIFQSNGLRQALTGESEVKPGRLFSRFIPVSQSDPSSGTFRPNADTDQIQADNSPLLQNRGFLNQFYGFPHFVARHPLWPAKSRIPTSINRFVSLSQSPVFIRQCGHPPVFYSVLPENTIIRNSSAPGYTPEYHSNYQTAELPSIESVSDSNADRMLRPADFAEKAQVLPSGQPTAALRSRQAASPVNGDENGRRSHPLASTALLPARNSGQLTALKDIQIFGCFPVAIVLPSLRSFHSPDYTQGGISSFLTILQSFKGCAFSRSQPLTQSATARDTAGIVSAKRSSSNRQRFIDLSFFNTPAEVTPPAENHRYFKSAASASAKALNTSVIEKARMSRLPEALKKPDVRLAETAAAKVFTAIVNLLPQSGVAMSNRLTPVLAHRNNVISGLSVSNFPDVKGNQLISPLRYTMERLRNALFDQHANGCARLLPKRRNTVPPGSENRTGKQTAGVLNRRAAETPSSDTAILQSSPDNHRLFAPRDIPLTGTARQDKTGKMNTITALSELSPLLAFTKANAVQSVLPLSVHDLLPGSPGAVKDSPPASPVSGHSPLQDLHPVTNGVHASTQPFTAGIHEAQMMLPGHLNSESGSGVMSGKIPGKFPPGLAGHLIFGKHIADRHQSRESGGNRAVLSSQTIAWQQNHSGKASPVIQGESTLVLANKPAVREIRSPAEIIVLAPPAAQNAVQNSEQFMARQPAPITFRTPEPAESSQKPASPKTQAPINRLVTTHEKPVTSTIDSLKPEEINRLAEKVYTQLEIMLARDKRRFGL